MVRSRLLQALDDGSDWLAENGPEAAQTVTKLLNDVACPGSFTASELAFAIQLLADAEAEIRDVGLRAAMLLHGNGPSGYFIPVLEAHGSAAIDAAFRACAYLDIDGSDSAFVAYWASVGCRMSSVEAFADAVPDANFRTRAVTLWREVALDTTPAGMSDALLSLFLAEFKLAGLTGMYRSAMTGLHGLAPASAHEMPGVKSLLKGLMTARASGTLKGTHSDFALVHAYLLGRPGSFAALKRRLIAACNRPAGNVMATYSALGLAIGAIPAFQGLLQPLIDVALETNGPQSVNVVSAMRVGYVRGGYYSGRVPDALTKGLQCYGGVEKHDLVKPALTGGSRAALDALWTSFDTNCRVKWNTMWYDNVPWSSLSAGTFEWLMEPTDKASLTAVAATAFPGSDYRVVRLGILDPASVEAIAGEILFWSGSAKDLMKSLLGAAYGPVGAAAVPQSVGDAVWPDLAYRVLRVADCRKRCPAPDFLDIVKSLVAFGVPMPADPAVQRSMFIDVMTLCTRLLSARPVVEALKLMRDAGLQLHSGLHTLTLRTDTSTDTHTKVFQVPELLDIIAMCDAAAPGTQAAREAMMVDIASTKDARLAVRLLKGLVEQGYPLTASVAWAASRRSQPAHNTEKPSGLIMGCLVGLGCPLPADILVSTTRTPAIANLEAWEVLVESGAVTQTAGDCEAFEAAVTAKTQWLWLGDEWPSRRDNYVREHRRWLVSRGCPCGASAAAKHHVRVTS